MKAEPGSTEERVAAALERLGLLLHADAQGRAREEGLSALQARVLARLERRGRARVGALAEELSLTIGTVSAAVSVLEAKGLVSKGEDPEEHRAVVVAPTRAGAASGRRAAAGAGRLLANALGSLPRGSGEELLVLLLSLLLAAERQGLVGAARMCPTCRFFRPGAGKGSRPHFCALLEAPIGSADLRVDCPEHAPGRERAVDPRELLRPRGGG